MRLFFLSLSLSRKGHYSEPFVTRPLHKTPFARATFIHTNARADGTYSFFFSFFSFLYPFPVIFIVGANVPTRGLYARALLAQDLADRLTSSWAHNPFYSLRSGKETRGIFPLGDIVEALSACPNPNDFANIRNGTRAPWMLLYIYIYRRYEREDQLTSQSWIILGRILSLYTEK